MSKLRSVFLLSGVAVTFSDCATAPGRHPAAATTQPAATAVAPPSLADWKARFVRPCKGTDKRMICR